MINIQYPENLLYLLKSGKSSFIPKKIPNKQKYFKLYHKYYIYDFIHTSYFKIIDSFYVDNDQYITLSFSDEIYWTIPNNIIYYDNSYELIYDKNKILNQNIINSKESYPGYQILYWFFNNYKKKHVEFKPYIEDNGKSRIQENCNYFLYADYVKGKYTNLKIILDRRNKNDFNERIEGKEIIENI